LQLRKRHDWDSAKSDASIRCSSGAPLSGASYHVAKSRFAFGGKPSQQKMGDIERWVGPDGVVAIFSDGSELGVMNGGAPETNLPDWSADPTKLLQHAKEYWVSMGVQECQIMDAGTNGSSSGTRTITFARGVYAIPVVESIAAARFDKDDQTTEEAFYWPEIPAKIVTAANAFQKRLADPSALAAYKAKLPSEAQAADGQVVIHHTSAGSTSSFETATTYEVTQSRSMGSVLEFDEDGKPVTTTW
jgi:hypothetical protein